MRDSRRSVIRWRTTSTRRNTADGRIVAAAGEAGVLKTPSPIVGDGALPIVIGVTGHRDLRTEDITRLESVVHHFLAKLESDYPRSPLTLFSPLAEGADRLVARVSLARGARLIVPLPFSRDVYMRDFTTTGSRDEFEMLMMHAAESFVIEGGDIDEVARGPISRSDSDRQYARVGAFIARTSQILLAMWDGEPRQLEGGTAQVVRYRLEGPPIELAPNGSLLDAPLNGPVYHIVTPTRSKPVPVGEPFSLHRIFPTGFEARAFERVLGRIDEYNRDEQQLRARIAGKHAESRSRLLPHELESSLSPSFRALLWRFATADTLAIHFQRQTLLALLLLIAGVFVGVFIFEVYGHVAYNTHWLLGAYLGTLLATWLYHRHAKRAGLQSKYLDYRALAEGVRVQFFWCLAGVRDIAADYYLRKQRSVLDWISDALRTWSIEALSREQPTSIDDSGVALAVRLWVDEQAVYFERAAKRVHRHVERIEWWSDRFFAAGLVIATTLLIGHRYLLGELRLGHFPLLAVGLCLLSAGALHGYLTKRALRELSKQFERMISLYAHAQGQLHRLVRDGDFETARTLLKELGIEALVENGDWLLMHRERPLEFSKGH